MCKDGVGGEPIGIHAAGTHWRIDGRGCSKQSSSRIKTDNDNNGGPVENNHSESSDSDGDSSSDDDSGVKKAE